MAHPLDVTGETPVTLADGSSLSQRWSIATERAANEAGSVTPVLFRSMRVAVRCWSASSQQHDWTSFGWAFPTITTWNGDRLKSTESFEVGEEEIQSLIVSHPAHKADDRPFGDPAIPVASRPLQSDRLSLMYERSKPPCPRADPPGRVSPAHAPLRE